MVKSFIVTVMLFVGLCTSAQASCQAFVPQCEKKYDLPPGLLKAILTVESRSTPWAVYSPNSSRFFKKKEDAIKHIQRLKNAGCTNINVGCAQLDVRSHAHRFKSIGHFIDPVENVTYAARFLRKLYNRYGSWEKAVRYYNGNNRPYQAKVWRVWKQQEAKTTPQLVKVKQVVSAPSSKG